MITGLEMGWFRRRPEYGGGYSARFAWTDADGTHRRMFVHTDETKLTRAMRHETVTAVIDAIERGEAFADRGKSPGEWFRAGSPLAVPCPECEGAGSFDIERGGGIARCSKCSGAGRVVRIKKVQPVNYMGIKIVESDKLPPAAIVGVDPGSPKGSASVVVVHGIGGIVESKRVHPGGLRKEDQK